MSKAQKLKIIAGIVFVGFCFSTFIHYLQYTFFKQVWPFNTYLYTPDDVWADFFGLHAMNVNMDPFHQTFRGFGNNYPPFAYLAISVFTQLGKLNGAISYSVFFVSFYSFFVWRYFRDFNRSEGSTFLYTAIVAFLSYPLHFAFDRLNLENLIFVLVAVFYMFLLKNRFVASAIAIGIAAAIKVYPGLFAILLLQRKQFRALFVAIVTFVACTILAMVVFKTDPMEIYSSYSKSAPLFKQFTLSYMGIPFSSSLFAALRALDGMVNPQLIDAWDHSQKILDFYLIAAVILGLIVLPAVMSKRISTWERLILLSFIILVLPVISFDYKMLYLYISLAAFLNSTSDERLDLLFSVFFGFILIPKAFFIIFRTVNFGVILNPLLLLIAALYIAGKAYRLWGAAAELQATRHRRKFIFQGSDA